MKFFKYIFVAIIFLTNTAYGAADKKYINIALYEDYYPFSTINYKGEPAGLFVDMWKKLSEKSGIEVRFIKSNWSKSLENVKDGTADIHIGLAYSEKRAKDFVYSLPFYEIAGGVFFNNSIKNVSSIDFFYKSKIAVNRNTILHELILSRFPESEVILCDNFEEMVKMVLNQKADALIDLYEPSEQLLREMGVLGKFDFILDDKLKYKIYTASNISNHHIIELVNEGLNKIPYQNFVDIEKNWIKDPEKRYYSANNKNIEFTDEELKYIKTAKDILVQNETNYPPFNYNEGGVPKGFMIDYVQLLSEKTDLNFRFVTGPSWHDFINMIARGDIDVMVNIVSSDERKKFINFTQEFFMNQPALILRQDDTSTHSLDDLKGKKVAVPKSFVFEGFLRKYYKGIKIVIYENLFDCFDAVASNKADAALSSLYVADYIIKYNRMEGLKTHAGVGDDRLIIPYSIGVRKDDEILLSILSKAIDSVSFDEFKQINEKWFEQENENAKMISLDESEKKFIAKKKYLTFSEVNWKPLSIVDNEKKYEGIIADYLKIISDRSGLRFKYEKSDTWADVLNKYVNKKLDVVPALGEDDKIGRKILLSEPFITFPLVIVTRTDEPYISETSNLKDKKVAVGRGYTSYHFLHNNYKNIHLVQTDNVEQALIMVSNGQVDAFVGHLAVAIDNMQELGFKNLKIAGSTEYRFDHRIGVDDEFPEAVSIINKVLSSMTEEEHREIYRKWLVVNYNKGKDYSLAIKLTLTALAAILIIFYWNRKLYVLNKNLNIEVKERNRAEQALRKSEKVYRDLVEGANSIILRWDRDGRIKFMNPFGLNFFGYTFDEIFGKTVSDTIIAKKESFTDRDLHQLMQDIQRNPEKFQNSDNENTKKDGTKVWVSWTNRISLDEKGELNEILSVGNDITERRKAEDESERLIEELRLANERIVSQKRELEREVNERRTSEFRFRSMAEMLPQSIFEVSVNGELLYGNRQLFDFTGYNEEEIGERFNIFNVFHEDDLDKLRRNLLDSSMGLKDKPADYMIRKADGSYADVLIYSTPVSMDEKIQGLIGIIVDISERKKIEEALRATDKAKGAFLANMSHEIRTPLNAIIGLTKLFENTELSEKQLDYVRKINSSSKSLLGIVNDILDFSKIESGKLELENIDFDLEETLNNVKDLVSVKSEEKGLSLNFEILDGTPLKLVGDPLRFAQILINLADNAVKFTDTGEIKIKVYAENILENKASIIVEVIDTGIGISDENINKLFNSFSQLDSSNTRKFGGTGLGLTISRELAELMGGYINVESELGVGSRFIFKSCININEKAVNVSVEKDLIDKRVMIVDDNRSSCLLLAGALQNLNLITEYIVDPDEALKKIADASETQDRYDVILLDYDLKTTNGALFCEKVKKLKNPPFVIIITTYNENDIINEAIMSGVDSFMCKPVELSVLYSNIAELFGIYTVDYRKKTENPSINDMHGEWVLLVEDNIINQQVAKELLEQAGLKVFVVSNGLECVENINAQNFKAVIMDIQMPVMDGYEAFSRLEQMNVSIPVIAMTAHAFSEEKEKCLSSGMAGYLSKPIDQNELYSLLAVHIKDFNANVSVKNSFAADQIQIIGIDSKKGFANVGHNEKLYVDLLNSYAGEYGDHAGKLIEFTEPVNYEELERLAHYIKGASGNIGAFELYNLCAKLERLASQKSGNIKDIVAQIIDVNDSLIKNIKDYDFKSVLMDRESDSKDLTLNELLINLHKYSETRDSEKLYEILQYLKVYLPGRLDDDIDKIEKFLKEENYEIVMDVIVEILHVLNIKPENM